MQSASRGKKQRCDVRAVVTAPDKPRGRGQHVTQTPVGVLAAARGIPVLQPDTLKDPAFVSRIAALAPDLIVVVAFRILPPEVYTLAREEPIGGLVMPYLNRLSDLLVVMARYENQRADGPEPLWNSRI